MILRHFRWQAAGIVDPSTTRYSREVGTRRSWIPALSQTCRDSIQLPLVVSTEINDEHLFIDRPVPLGMASVPQSVVSSLSDRENRLSPCPWFTIGVTTWHVGRLGLESVGCAPPFSSLSRLGPVQITKSKIMAGSSKQGVPSEGCENDLLLMAHIKAIKNVIDALECWEDSDSELINGTEVFIDKVLSKHPLHLAVKELRQYYPYSRLPDEPRQNWREFLFFTRVDPATHDSVNSAVTEKFKLVNWAKGEIQALKFRARSPEVASGRKTLDDLPNARRKAYTAYLWAEQKVLEDRDPNSKVTDFQVYEYLKENGLPEEMNEYSLPPKGTFVDYCIQARGLLECNKNHRREKLSPNGKSVVRDDQIEP